VHRCQGIFVTLAFHQSWLWPNRTVGQAVYLYIATSAVNVLNCRDEVSPLAGLPVCEFALGGSGSWR
jgi:hypothetical protein